jgi:predicted amidohydrolase YtcJ
MKQKARIPLLKDHHSHPYLYAALASCPDIRFVKEKERALEMIARHSVSDEVNVVIGWNDSLYGFSRADLDPLPPQIMEFVMGIRPCSPTSASNRISTGTACRNSSWP